MNYFAVPMKCYQWPNMGFALSRSKAKPKADNKVLFRASRDDTFILSFFFSLTTTGKHSNCSDTVKCPESLLHKEGQRFQEVIGIDPRLVWFLLQKVALWDSGRLVKMQKIYLSENL